MMSSRRDGTVRDTAKDIILGTQPSGLAPREPPRAGTTRPLPQVDPPDPRLQTGRGPPVNDPVLDARLASAERGNRSVMEELMKVQNQMRALQRLHDEQISQEQEGRRRLEASLRASHDAIGRLSERSKNDPTGYL